MSSPTLIDLPLDVLLLIIPYLGAHDFLSLCSTCHTLHDEFDLKYSPAYWSILTRSTFRVPNQPVVQGDGLRWMKLYRRMRIQSRIYAWGNNDGGCFGGTEMTSASAAMRRPPHLRAIRGRSRVTHMPVLYSTTPRLCPMGRVGVVSDLQCGGWMTVMLNSNGSVFINGAVSGLFGQAQPPTLGDPKPLKYPQGFVSPEERYDPLTAIRQMSAGRSHVLALADCGRIWSWESASLHAFQVKFVAVELQERSKAPPTTRRGLVTKVAAGWDRSSAYIVGTGIVLWRLITHDRATESHQSDQTHDTMLVNESWTIPYTGFTQEKGLTKTSDNADFAMRVGEVRNWIVLDIFVVFVTDPGKVFAWRIPSDEEHDGLSQPMEISTSTASGEQEVVDVQGSFRYFAALLKNGEVLTGNTERLQEAWNAHVTSNSLEPAVIGFEQVPSLQHTNVISLAFGDWHMHALHANGTITSHGKEPELKGALGLGGLKVSILRGMAAAGPGEFHPDGKLLRQCETTGRVICFEPEKHSWLYRLSTTTDNGSFERFKAVADRTQVRAVMSEWVEQKLRSWDSHDTQSAALTTDDDDDGLPAYFALSVAAAGHHSGAIVLVNEEMANARKAEAQARYKASQEMAVASTAIESTHLDDEQSLQSSLSSNLRGAARWFLGTPTDRSSSSEVPTLPPVEPCLYCAATDNSCDRNHPCSHCNDNGRTDDCVYPEPSDWWFDTLPRLRLPDGEELPGEGPISDWTCPEFKTY